MKKMLSPIFLFIALSVSGAIALFTSYTFETVHVRSSDATVVSEQMTTNPWVEERLKEMSLTDKIGQFFMMASSSNKGVEHYLELEKMISDHKIGGVIFFQGEREDLKIAIDRYQAKSKVPLLIAMDAEWGVGMRLSGEGRFPYNYTLGAADDTVLSQKVGRMIAEECRELGIHINFAPVADVNSNPANPVIGFRSFGEHPRLVARHVAATVRGMEAQGVMTSIKHFPGHGDTDTDSHYELPVVNNTYNQINAMDFPPFIAGIKAGAGSVMIGHLNVPSLDPSGTPTSLSKPVIQNYLKKELGFKGLVVSDALRMKAVADRYGATEAVVMAFEAGIDILLIPESLGEAITAIESRVKSGKISEEEIDQRCRKVLQAKYDYIVTPKQYEKFTAGEIQLVKRQVYEKAITVIKNENAHLPIRDYSKRIAVVSIGTTVDPFHSVLKNVGDIDLFHAYSGFEAKKNFSHLLKNYDLVVTTVHTNSVISTKDFGIPKSVSEWVNGIPAEKRDVLVLFGNPLALRNYPELELFESIVVGYENNEICNDRVGQFLVGALPSEAELTITINQKFPISSGVRIEATGRLKDSQPEEVGIDPSKLTKIDEIVHNAIKEGAFPGCQIAVAVKGKLIYHKAFGNHIYTNGKITALSDLYDIASVTKIAASTTALMKLQSQDKFTLNTTLENYLPDLTNNTNYASVRLKDMMAHQAGFVAWVPFYTATLSNGQLRKDLYSSSGNGGNSVAVTPDLFLVKSYTDSIYKRLVNTPRKERGYKYSDLGYYFVKQIVEKQSGLGLDEYLEKEIYKPLGLQTLRYNPLRYFPKDRIAPTENDQIYRKQQIHGTVHDQGAAMLGGVGGHAGLFSNARDLAQLMQLFLDKGSFGGARYIDSDVIEEYTSYQFPNSRRGAGFDKPVLSGSGGPCSDLCSKRSYGHSGFTGTLVWTDPDYDLTFVFLSNRVYPDAENWKIVNMGTRTEIQRVIYEALKAAK